MAGNSDSFFYIWGICTMTGSLESVKDLPEILARLVGEWRLPLKSMLRFLGYLTNSQVPIIRSKVRFPVFFSYRKDTHQARFYVTWYMCVCVSMNEYENAFCKHWNSNLIFTCIVCDNDNSSRFPSGVHGRGTQGWELILLCHKHSQL